MVKLPDSQRDPTLAAMDEALRLRAESTARYSSRMGASVLGDGCSRRIWYGLRWFAKDLPDDVSQRRFDDGHHSELVMAERLRLVDGVRLLTIDEKTGEQYTFTAADGHVVCKLDGIIKGLKHDPANWYVWEHKCTNDEKYRAAMRAKAINEDTALKEWDAVYYAQAQVAMHLTKIQRHYLTIASEGSRCENSIITQYNARFAEGLIDKAERILGFQEPPEKAYQATFWKCKVCPFAKQCHWGGEADMNCRTCKHASPADKGGWHCGVKNKTLTHAEQLKGCEHYEAI